MTQLTDKIREALLGNVGTIICGRVGVTDADLMVKAFSPTFTAEDLTKTPNHAAICKVMMFGMPSAAFTMNLPRPMGEPNEELMKRLKEYTAAKYGRSRAEVEQEIQDRWNAAEREKEEKAEQEIAAKDAERGFLDEWVKKRQNDASGSETAVTEPSTASQEPQEDGFSGELHRDE